MNCHEFRQSVVEKPAAMSRGETPGDFVYAHAAECEACAAWLAAEKELVASFSVLKQQDERLQAPAPLASALFAEFRAAHPARASVRPIGDSQWRWWVGAAAAVLMLALWFARPQREPADSARDSITLAAPKPDELVRKPAPQTDQPPEQPSAAAEPRVELREQPPPAAPGETAVAPAENRQPQPVAGETTPPTVGAREREIVTEFVPLTYAGLVTPAPDSRLVRVRLPSTALAYFGLPGSAASRSVEADVLLGHDGLAYAVRFVRPTMAVSPSDRTNSESPQPY
jgi:hypothetical protein